MKPVPPTYKTIQPETAEAVPIAPMPSASSVGVYALCVVLIVAGLVAFKRIVKGN